MSDFELGDFGGGETGGFPQMMPQDWTSGQDLGGGGDTGIPTLPGTSFNVGLGQDPSAIYQALISAGVLQPGANVPGISGGGLKLPGGGGRGGGGSSNPFSMTNPDGSMNWAALVPLLASIFGGATSYNATKSASSDMVNALNSANQQITGLLGPGGASAAYKPYQTVGEMATGKLGAYNYKPLAPIFPSAVKGK